ncbi:MAG: TonB-dependent receptor, partial [Acidobacteriota bacterium]|nr:TonB-dependent receptor [Acidobacteriota bacterium]
GGAGIVMLITKGGTDSFHGEVYDYLQNSALNANGWTNNKNGAPRGPFKQNQFGGNVSGPILKRAHLFFFGGYEGLRQPNTQNTGLLTVPTAAERTGNFSQTLNADGSPDLIYNPFTTTALDNTGANYTRQQFAGNVVPSNLINPVGQKIVNLFPLPNRAGVGPNDINNYFAQGSGNTLNDKMDTRVDWEQSSINRMFVRWSDRFRQDQTLPCFFCNGADQGNNQANSGIQLVLNDTVTPNPSWVLDTYISYSRWQEKHIAQGYGTASAATIGLSPALFQAPLLPTISTGGSSYTGLGNGSYQTYTRYSNTIQINVTKQLSKHTIRFGANYDDMMINSVSESAGNFDFGSGLTSCDPSGSGGPCTALNYGSSLSGNPIASMLLGTATGGGQSINIDPAMTLHSYGLYIQDQWRVNQRLTVSAGLRYENQRPATERLNRLMFFNTTAVNPISAAVGQTLHGEFEYAGINGNDRYAWAPNNLDFAPRLGIAYKITDKLVARAGAGIFYLPPSAMISFDGTGQFYGYSSTTSYIPTTNNGFTPLNLINNPFPQGILQPQGSSQGGLTLVGTGDGQIWPKGSHPTPYTEQWSFNLQYQLSPRSVLEVGYLGNKGRKLLYGNPNLDADQLPGQYLGLGSQLDQLVTNPFYGKADSSTYLGSQPQIAYNELLRPYPQYTYLQWTRSLPGARSSFNALNVKYNHSFSAGLSLLMTYQWSKALDNGPEDNFGWATGNSWRDSYHTNLDYGISSHDVPQSFVTALVYDLPYGDGKHWGSSATRIVKEVLGNWQVSTVVRLASGLPIGPVVEQQYNQLNNYGFPGPTLPNLVSSNVTPSNQNPNGNWINPAAFSAPAPYTLGNAPQRLNQLRERAARNADISVAKNFGTEHYQAWLRGEFINAFNYAQYNNFCLDLSGACGPVGTAYGTENQPRIVQLSLKLSF